MDNIVVAVEMPCERATPRIPGRRGRDMARARHTGRATEEEAVLYALRRRGVECRCGRSVGALVPPSAAAQDRLYGLLGHYSFRLFLRDLIRLRAGARLEELTRYCSLPAVERFVAALEQLGVVRRSSGKVVLCDQQVRSFGPTLEWYVAEVLRREFGMTAAWNLRPYKTSSGGDYDVVGVADGALVYVETKAAAPRNIEVSQIDAFVRRVVALAPDVVVFINDTQLRMLDKLVPAIGAAVREQAPHLGPFRRLQGEIFAAGGRFFVTNSEPDLAGNLGTCLSRFFRTRAGWT
jgi:hypothetical protein